MKLRRATFGVVFAAIAVLSAATVYAAGSTCTATKLTVVDHVGSDGSECDASSDGKSKGHSTAAGDKAFAEADAQTHGKATATASGTSSFSDASADTGGHSTAHAMGDGSQANAATDSHGKATSMSNGDGSEADTQAFGKCKATAKATTGVDAPATAVADCSHPGKFATAIATNGGSAEAHDDAAPMCDPGPHGTAMVKSSGGNCP